MLKVIIADDEARICKLIQILADWDSLGMEVIGYASNGLEALDLIAEYHPDILITDIRMPGCSGLELIELVKRKEPNLEIVIISGYAHFDYAQSAIKHGVGDYLLKPIKKDELMSTLEKLGARCRQRRQSLAEVEQLRQTSQENLERLRGDLIRDLLDGRLEVPTAQRLQSQYHFPAKPGLYQAFAIKMDYDSEAFSTMSVCVLLERADEGIRAELPELCHTLVLASRAPWVWGVLNYPAKNREQIRKAMRRCLNHLMAQQPLFGAIEFTLALGQSVKTPEELPLSVQSARAAAAERLIEGTGRVLEGAPEAPRDGDEKLLDRYRRAMEQAVENISVEEALSAADLLEREAAQSPGLNGRELQELVSSAGRLFLLRIDVHNREQALRVFDQKCGQCSKVAELFECLRELERQQLALVEEQRQNESIRPIRIARQYIQQHFCEQITLEDVCAAAGFSVSYFSGLFKKETGEGFAKYLTRIRIEKAKELLQETNLPIAEICRSVGYGDLKHFNQTFKKITSLNPGQYRKLYG